MFRFIKWLISIPQNLSIPSPCGLGTILIRSVGANLRDRSCLYNKVESDSIIIHLLVFSSESCFKLSKVIKHSIRDLWRSWCMQYMGKLDFEQFELYIIASTLIFEWCDMNIITWYNLLVSRSCFEYSYYLLHCQIAFVSCWINDLLPFN